MRHTTWAPPYWEVNDKHLPPGGNVKWAECVQRTAHRGQPAKYHQNFKPADIQRLEMLYSSLSGKYVFGTQQFDYWTEFLREAHSVAFYAIFVKGLIVGASRGEETNIVIVNRSQSGLIHGYPATEHDVNRKRERFR